MKKFRNFVSIIVAMIMVLVMALPTLASDITDTPEDTPTATSTVPDKTIQLTGLQATDSVSYINVIKWNSTIAGWEWNSDVVNTTGDGALTAADLAEVVGNPDTETDGKITPEMASKITGNIKTGLTWASDGSNNGGTWNSPSTLAIGLYVAQAVPTTAGIVYNPVFLGVNPPKGTGTTADISVLNYAPDGAAKKQTTDVEKTAKDKNGNQVHATDENVGDEIEFTVKTTLPVFMDNYKNPMFKVSDTLTSGLSYVENSIKVKIGEAEYTATTPNVLTLAQTPGAGNGTNPSWTVDFDAAYLKNVATPTEVIITYKAIITDAAASVNPEENTAKIEYSRNPNNENDHGTEEDKTKHYTFGLDINMLGNEEYITSEFVKVGKDKNGNYRTKEKGPYSNKTQQHPLEGARFLLYKGSGESKTPYTNGINDPDSQTIVNGAPKGKEYFSTDEWGKFDISGLEAGTYTLVETKAPAGYKKAADTLIEIIAEFDDETDPTMLTGYKVKIGGVQAASYTMDAGTAVVEQDPETAAAAGDNNTQEIVDIQGVELPSTGGIGTTIFYIVGAILVIGAGILLVTRRRMKVQ